jgi:hypothetical protein
VTLAEYSLTAFAVLNGGRAVAYFPQLLRVYRDPHGAAAVSLSTWILFAAANIATVCYALTTSNDHVVAIVFGLNAIGCLAIAGLTAFKRANLGRQATPWITGESVEALRCSQELVSPADVPVPGGAPDYSPSARVRDEMIRQGLMG